MVPNGNALGDFLRARRDQVQPEEVGLVAARATQAPTRRADQSVHGAGLRGERLPGCVGVKLARASALTGIHAGTNFLRWRLLDPAARQLYVDWDEATDSAVSGLREYSSLYPAEDPRMRALRAELSAASQRFNELWNRASVGYQAGMLHLRHPQVGDLHLTRNRLNAPRPGGDHLIVYYAEPGSDSAAALEELRALSAQEQSRNGETVRSD